MVTAIIVGYNHWGDYTFPLLQSAKRTNPDMKLVCVDNASAEPYPNMAGVKIIRSSKQLGLAGGLNLGLQSVDSDWYVCLNQDVPIHKPIAKRIEGLKPDGIYGFYMRPDIEDAFTLGGWSYLSNWCLFLPRKVWLDVGDWDEKCFPMYWEDADYSKRVVDAGYKLHLLDRNEWGVEHLMVEAKKQYRRDYARDKATEIDILRAYVRAKHGL